MFWIGLYPVLWCLSSNVARQRLMFLWLKSLSLLRRDSNTNSFCPRLCWEGFPSKQWIPYAVSCLTIMTSNSKDYDISYKVLVIGESAVGKTSLIKSYSKPDETFTPSLMPTYGVWLSLWSIKENDSQVNWSFHKGDFWGLWKRDEKFFYKFLGIPIIGGKKNNMLWAVNILQVYK